LYIHLGVLTALPSASSRRTQLLSLTDLATGWGSPAA